MTKYQNLQGLKVFNQNLPFLLQNPQFSLLNRPSEILLKSSILCSKKSRRVEIFLKSKIFLKLNMLKSKNYCNDFASDTDKILGGGGYVTLPPALILQKQRQKWCSTVYKLRSKRF